VGRFPGSLNDLAMPPAGMTQQQWRGPYLDDGKVPVDPWGSEFTYTPDDATDRVLISSRGADGQPGTADDVPGPINN
jgi:general secretion pathway protein G